MPDELDEGVEQLKRDDDPGEDEVPFLGLGIQARMSSL